MQEIKNKMNKIENTFKRNEEVKQTLLPKMIMVSLILLLFLRSMPIVMVYAYAPQMVKSFGFEEVDVGTYTGIFASAGYCGRMLFSFIWGYLADKRGKRFATLLCATGLTLMTLAFGFSTNYTFAITTRLLQGCFMGLIVPCKAFIRQVCDDTNVAFAMSLISSATSLGHIIGPSAAGILVFPGTNFPETFPAGSFFSKFEILLPNLLVVVGLIFALLVGFFWLPPDQEVRKCQSKESIYRPCSKAHLSIIDRYRNTTAGRLFSNGHAILCCFINGTFTALVVGVLEVFPVYLSTSLEYGGAGLSSQQIGLVMLLSAIVVILVQVFISPLIIKRFGSKLVGVSAAVALVFIIPTIALSRYVSDVSLYLLWTYLSVYFFLCRITISLCFISTNVMLNNVVDSSLTGSINGLSTTLTSIGSMMAPMAFNTIYSWSLTQEIGVEGNEDALGFPFNHYLTFFVMSLLSLTISIVISCLPKDLNKMKN